MSGAILTQGLGSFGSPSLILTLGLGSSTDTNTGLLGGKAFFGKDHYSYSTPYQRHKEELDTLAEKLAAIDANLAEQENIKLLSGLKAEADNKKAAKKAALEAKKAQEEINRFLMMRAELIRRITDEEEAFIVLFSLPFIN